MIAVLSSICATYGPALSPVKVGVNKKVKNHFKNDSKSPRAAQSKDSGSPSIPSTSALKSTYMLRGNLL